MGMTETGRRFEFIREIASGGFGSVFLAKVVHPDGFARLAAVKLLHPKWSENHEIASRMRDEARLLGWLRHRNIVEVLDLTRIEGRVAVIMEYLEAVDLNVVLSALRKEKEQIPLKAVLEIVSAVCSALDAAYNRPPHAGEKPLRVVHRDIKPSNIMVDAAGTVKVLDFGVARADFSTREAVTQAMAFGSSDYMPAERVFLEPDTANSDVYSVGATLYEMLALERYGKVRIEPTDADTMFSARWESMAARRAWASSDLRDGVRRMLSRMMAFESEDRASTGDVVTQTRALLRLCDDESLADWSDRFLPGLVQAFHQRQPSGPPNPLLQRTIIEDSRGIPSQGGDSSETYPPSMAYEPTAPDVQGSDPEPEAPTSWGPLVASVTLGLGFFIAGLSSVVWVAYSRGMLR